MKFAVKIAKKGLCKKFVFSKVIGSKLTTLLKMNFLIGFFKDFSCKFQNTYFPKHLLAIVTFRHFPWEFRSSFVVPNLLHSGFIRRKKEVKQCFPSLLSSVKTFGNKTVAILLPVRFSKWYNPHGIQVFSKVKLCLIIFLLLMFHVFPSYPPLRSVEVNREIPSLVYSNVLAFLLCGL